MLTRDEVIWGFRYCLGRDPESESVVEGHRNFNGWKELRNALLRCPEFVNGDFACAGLENRWVIAPVMGGKRLMWVDLGDRYVSRACIRDDYEPNETRFIQKYLNTGDVFLDVGANIGWYTLLASTIVGEYGRIYAIEPRPGTFERLQETIALNKLQNKVKLYQLAVSDKSGSGFLSWVPQTDNPGGSFLSNEDLSGNMVSHPVELVTIDSLDINTVNFIKIDVEGSEYRAIMGAMNLILKNRPIILSEILPLSLQRISGKSADEYLELFLKLDYKIFIIDGIHGGKEIRNYPRWWERDVLNVGMIPQERI
jgi:FkbM family methyltransferase